MSFQSGGAIYIEKSKGSTELINTNIINNRAKIEGGGLAIIYVN